MTDLEELQWLFRIGRADRDGLLEIIEELGRGDVLQRESGLDDSEQMRYLRALTNVDNVERMLASAPAPSDERRFLSRGGRAARRTVTIDVVGYDEDKKYLHAVAEESESRKRLQKAARRRLSHFEKRDGLTYRKSDRTPLESYQTELRTKCI